GPLLASGGTLVLHARRGRPHPAALAASLFPLAVSVGVRRLCTRSKQTRSGRRDVPGCAPGQPGGHVVLRASDPAVHLLFPVDLPAGLPPGGPGHRPAAGWRARATATYQRVGYRGSFMRFRQTSRMPDPNRQREDGSAKTPRSAFRTRRFAFALRAYSALEAGLSYPLPIGSRIWLSVGVWLVLTAAIACHAFAMLALPILIF